MKKPYTHLSLVTVPLVDASESVGLGRAVCKEIAEKKLPPRLQGVATRVVEATKALEAKLAKRARKGAGVLPVERADVDVRADQLLGSLHDVWQGFARQSDKLGVPQAPAARTLVAVVFPEGLSAVVHATYVGQYERMKTAFAALDHKKSGHAARVALTATSETVKALRALMPEYETLVETLLAKSEPAPVEYVRDELVALREALAAFARTVDGDAASGNRNAELRATRLLLPLRALAGSETDKRARKAAKKGDEEGETEGANGAEKQASGAKK